MRGALRVALLSDFPAQLRRRQRLYLGEEHRPVDVSSIRAQGDRLIVQLVDVDSPEAAAALREQWLYVRRDEAARPPRGQHFEHEVLGLCVETSDGEALGSIVEIIRTGANDVYVIRGPDGRELLLPAISDVVKSLDVAGGRVVVDLLPGLLPGTQEEL